MRLLSILALGLALVACADRPAIHGDEGVADTVFFGQHILSMEEASPKAEAVAIKGADILFVGTAKDARSYIGPKTRLVELGDKAMLPGFIDAHGHFTAAARFMDFANLAPPPVGTVTDIDGLIQALQAYIQRSEGASGWVFGYGYDDALLAENRHPTRDDLDRVSGKIPIVLVHVSYHFVAVNSAALEALGIDAQTHNPKGGLIRRRPGSQTPDGVLEETATYPALYRLSQVPPEQFEQALRKTANYYASFGITTAQDGASSPQDLGFLRAIAAKKRLPIDVILYQHVAPSAPIAEFVAEQAYNQGIRLAGVKFVLDGSPQGRTAWVTRPYELNAHFSQKNHLADSVIDRRFYRDAVRVLLDNNVQMLSHANGDAAIDLMLDSLEEAVGGRAGMDHRAVIIHAQLMRRDQMQRAKNLNAMPSFFSAHPFFWGDWHWLNFGRARASHISPTRWAKNAGLVFTIHNDAPIVPPDIMHLLWVTVNRKTRTNRPLGAGQRLSVLEALQATTIHAAYQCFEENAKGSIRQGKRADLVILNQNPLLVDPGRLHKVKVIETIARGETIYVSPN